MNTIRHSQIPKERLSHFNTMIQNLFSGGKSKTRSFIADRVLPRIPVSSPQFRYIRQAGSATVEPNSQWQITKGNVNTYAIDDFLEIDSYEEEDQNSSIAISQSEHWQAVLSRASTMLSLERERRVAAFISDSLCYGQNVMYPEQDWTCPDADPLAHIREAMQTPRIRPNTLIVSVDLWKLLRSHPRVRARYERPLSLNQLGSLLRLSGVVVGTAKYHVGRVQGTPQIRNIWENTCALVHTSPHNQSFGALSFGYTAQYQERSAQIIATSHESLCVRIKESIKEVVCNRDAGVLVQFPRRHLSQ